MTQGWIFLAKSLAAKYVVPAAANAAADVDTVAPASGGGVGWLALLTSVPSCGSSRTKRSGGGRCWPGDMVLRRLGGDGTGGIAAAEDDGWPRAPMGKWPDEDDCCPRAPMGK